MKFKLKTKLCLCILQNSVPTKILKLLINDVSSQVFLTLLFSFIFKVYKKYSKLKCSNCRPISLL